jgi:small subunit ribosomal protein S3
MGHKANPVAMRLGNDEVGVQWKSKWFAGKHDYKKIILEDVKIREYLKDRLNSMGLVDIFIERFNKRIKIILVVTRPGLVIGRGGKGLEELKKQLISMVSIENPQKNLEIQVEEFKNADLSSNVVANKMAYQILKRMPYRGVVNQAMERVMNAGAKGVKIVVKGRLNGVEISRQEKFYRGEVSLSTLRADIDYSYLPVLTRSGFIGIKVYINKGEVK